jgi:hypothetical protein
MRKKKKKKIQIWIMKSMKRNKERMGRVGRLEQNQS